MCPLIPDMCRETRLKRVTFLSKNIFFKDKRENVKFCKLKAPIFLWYATCKAWIQGHVYRGQNSCLIHMFVLIFSGGIIKKIFSTSKCKQNLAFILDNAKWEINT